MLAVELLEWAALTLSFFNTIAPLWLGLTVLLNAERRRWGTWVAGGGLILAGLLFAGHSALVARAGDAVQPEMEFWWRLSWAPFICGPYLWYVVIAWFSGVLGTVRHRLWLAILSLWALVDLLLLPSAAVLPAYGAIAQPAAPPSVAAPLLLALYPVYSILCILLALVALRRPGDSDRLMGQLARRRARPWLVAASLVLLAVSLGVAGFVAWLLPTLQVGRLDPLTPATRRWLLQIDLVVAALVAVAIMLIGRAVVSYEIFTGTVLPRAGLARHWRGSLLLAAGYSALVGGSLVLPLDSVYRLLLATLLMTLCLALLSWRSYREREASLARLRPFAASGRLYEGLLQPEAPTPAAADPLALLCREVLGARCAYLVPAGPLAAFVRPQLAVRDSATAASEPCPEAVAELAARSDQERGLCFPVAPACHGGAVWALPLWSERGTAGLLLLGEKGDGALYTQEELELARATAERLVDTLATAEMARRLLRLQRERLTESQVLDRQGRHVVHDEVLPRLHTAMLLLSGNREAGAAAAEALPLLADVHRQLADLLQAAPPALAPEVGRQGLVGTLRRLVEDELRGAFDGVTVEVEPTAAERAAGLRPLVAEVLYGAAREAVRNAARHGRGPATGRALHLLVAVRCQTGLEVAVEDDGVGLAGSGRSPATGGHGLALHSTLLAVVGGSLTVEGRPGGGTRVVLALPAAALDDEL